MRKPTVLFLCTGNSCRSIMSEALLRDRFGDRFDAYSAGTDPKGVHPMTVQVLKEIGIDTGPLRSKGVNEYLGSLWVNYLIIVCHGANDRCPRIFPGMVERFFWELDDLPAFEGSDEEKLSKFREVRDQIADSMDAWTRQLEASGAVATGGHLGG